MENVLCREWTIVIRTAQLHFTFGGKVNTNRRWYMYLLSVYREELDRKVDHKRQQIHSGGQEIRQLEQRVNQLRDEKV